jgi:hypothetical protein
MDIEYVDLLGLSPTLSLAQAKTYADAIGVKGVLLETNKERRALLLRMRHSAGLVVYTGPSGATFWSLASLEVKVRVVPDGTEYTRRTDDVRLWAALVVCDKESSARTLARRATAPKEGTLDRERWDRLTKAVRLLRKAEASGVGPPIVADGMAVDIVLDRADQRMLLDKLPRKQRVSLDWEWDEETSDPLGLAVSTADRNFYLPVLAADYQPQGADHGEFLRSGVADVLRRRTRTVWHSAASDLSSQYPGDPEELVFGRRSFIDDTLVMAYLVGEPDLHLKDLTRQRLNRDPMDYPSGSCVRCAGKGTVGKGEDAEECTDCRGTGKRGLKNVSVATAARYAAAGDTRNTLDLYYDLLPVLDERNQRTVYTDIERPLIPIIASMEKFGSPLNMAEVTRLHEEFSLTEEAMHSLLWQRFRVDVADASDNEAASRGLIKRLTGYDPGTMDQRTLSKIEDPWMDVLIGHRRLRTRRRNFLGKMLERWRAAGSPKVWSAYPHFNQAGSSVPDDPRSFKRAPRSGRLSSANPNFQNQPRDIRSAFVPPPGTSFWSLDYSGLELHIAAAVSGDKEMLRVLNEQCPDPGPDGCEHAPKHGDLHDAFHHKIHEYTGVWVGRVTAKAGNFEQLYGGGPDKLVQILQKERAFISLETARLVVKAHAETFPQYHQYAEKVVQAAMENGGYSETLFGRRRYERDLFSGDPETRSWAARALVNTTIQGTAADIMKMAMVWAVPVLRAYDAHVAIQVHDELTGWVPGSKRDKEAFLAAMRGVMQSVELPGLDLKAEGGVGLSWVEVH